MHLKNRDLIKAAEELKDHAWLARFRKANYENKHHEISPCAANDIAGWVDEFIDLVLESRSDDTLIDPIWLLEDGFKSSRKGAFDGYVKLLPCMPVRAEFMGGSCFVYLGGSEYAIKLKSRQEMIDLLRVLVTK